MVSVLSLWLPILVSAIVVFVVSSIIHMVLPYHRSDYGRVPSEDEVMESLRKYKIPPGDYLLPCPGTPAQMRSQEFVAKRDKGPVALMTVMPAGKKTSWVTHSRRSTFVCGEKIVVLMH